MTEAMNREWADFLVSPRPMTAEFRTVDGQPMRALNTAALLHLLVGIGIDWQRIR